MSAAKFFLRVASNTSEIFSNTTTYDALLYPANTSQTIIFGNSGGSNSALAISSNTVQFNGNIINPGCNIETSNNFLIGGIELRKDDGLSAFTTSINLHDYFVSSNGMRFHVDSNISSYQTIFSAGTSSNELMRLTACNGYLGIGDSNPQYKLSVVGSIDCSCNMYIGSNIGPGQSNALDITGNTGNVVCQGNISAGNLDGFRNKVINGNMFFFQRGLSAVSTSNNSAWTSAFPTSPFIDMFGLFYTITTGVVTQSRVTLSTSDTPYQYGFRYSYKATAATACTNYSFICPCTHVEEVNMLDMNWNSSTNRSPCTVSFWLRTNVATNAKVPLTLFSYSDSAAYHVNRYTYNTEITVATSGSWQYVTKTIDPPIYDGTGPDPSIYSINDYGMRIGIGGYSGMRTSILDSWRSPDANFGSNYIGTSNSVNIWGTLNNYVEFTGLQFEKGKVATPFEFRPFNIELSLCQRYFCTSLGTNMGYGAVSAYTYINGHNSYSVGISGASNYIQGPMFPVPMRNKPFFVFWNAYTATGNVIAAPGNSGDETTITYPGLNLASDQTEMGRPYIQIYSGTPPYQLYNYAWYAFAEFRR